MSPFFLSNKKIGPLELRPWTMTTQDAIHELKLHELSDERQAIACAWIQSREPEEVEKEISEGTALESINNFRRHFPMGLIRPIAEWCREQVACVDEGRVDVIPQPGGKSDAPKN